MASPIACSRPAKSRFCSVIDAERFNLALKEPPVPPDRNRQLDEDYIVGSSAFFLDLAAELTGDRVSVGDLIDRLAGRGVGILLLIFSLPLCIPNVPGISTLFGLLLLPPSLQMITGQRAVWFPQFVRRWSLQGDGLRAALRACGRVLRHFEFLAKPRLVFLTDGKATIAAGIQTFILALILLLPMPGANVIPGASVALTGLAILQKDGLFMLLSTFVAALAIGWVYLGGKYLIGFVTWVYKSACSMWPT